MTFKIDTDDFWKEIDKRVVVHLIEKKLMNDEIITLRQRVAELEKERDAAWKEAVEHVEAQQNIINELTAERDALKQQRDELVAAVEVAYKVASEHDDRLPFDWSVYCEMLYQAIASVKEK